MGLWAFHDDWFEINNNDNTTHNVKVEIVMGHNNELIYNKNYDVENSLNKTYIFYINNSMLNKIKDPHIYNFSVSVDSNPPVYQLIEYDTPLGDYVSIQIENSTPRILKGNIW